MRYPTNWSQLTLGQLQVLCTKSTDLQKVCAVCDISEQEARTIPMGDIYEILNRVNHIPEEARHEPIITLEGKKYGFIKDWDEFTTGEWIDCESYQEDFWANAHRIMAVLYRPMKYHVGKEYKLKAYTAKEDAEPFKKMPADLFSGALLFFWNTRIVRLQTLQASLLEAGEAVLHSQTSGAGTRSSISFRERVFSVWKKLRKSRLTSPSNTSPS
jgi:hypothetical protein